MASIEKLLSNKYYLRSCLFHINSKIEIDEKKKKKRKPGDDKVSMEIDENFKVFDQKDFSDESIEKLYNADIDRVGDDFCPNELYYYEYCIHGILDYITQKYKDAKNITELHFAHNNFSPKITYSTTIDKLKFLEPYYYITIFGMVIDKQHIVEATILNYHFNTHDVDNIIITYDKEPALDLSRHMFYELYCRKFDMCWTSNEEDTEKNVDENIDENIDEN